MPRDTSDRDAQVLAHVIKYPGLSSYEIARALHLTYQGRNVNKNGVEYSLMRLFFAGRITFEMVPWDAPGGHKRIWRAKTMKSFNTDQPVAITCRMDEWLFLTGWIRAHLNGSEDGSHPAVKLIAALREAYAE